LQIELKTKQDADSLEGDPDPVLSNIRNARVDTLPGQVRFTAELARWGKRACPLQKCPLHA
jgi:hypothetical protein